MRQQPTAHHVGITVADLDSCVEFYEQALGLEVLTRFSVGGEAFSTGVGIDDASANFAHLESNGIRLELVEYEPQGGELEGRDRLNRPGATHVGFEVEDLDAVYDNLPAFVETISEPQTTESGTRICFLSDPEDNLVELLEL